MDSNFQFRDASPPPIARMPSFAVSSGSFGALQLYWFRLAEADECSDDTLHRLPIAPTRTKLRQLRLSRAELKVRFHSSPAESQANFGTNRRYHHQHNR